MRARLFLPRPVRRIPRRLAMSRFLVTQPLQPLSPHIPSLRPLPRSILQGCTPRRHTRPRRDRLPRRLRLRQQVFPPRSLRFRRSLPLPPWTRGIHPQRFPAFQPINQRLTPSLARLRPRVHSPHPRRPARSPARSLPLPPLRLDQQPPVSLRRRPPSRPPRLSSVPANKSRIQTRFGWLPGVPNCLNFLLPGRL